jgi:class 3 adenylate cyclase
MSIASTWDRLSSLGLADQSTGERRRIRLTNQSAVIGTMSCGGFALAYFLAGPSLRAPMLANLASVLTLIGALVASARRASTLARVLVLTPVNLVVVVASLVLGGRLGFIYYFFLFAAVAFLLFERQPLLKWAYAFLSLAGCVVVLFLAPPDAPASVGFTPMITRLIDLTCAVGVMATVMFIVHLFTRDTTRAEERLAEEHARSERLLLNILPGAISARLKDTDQPIADGFAEVTVLFADLVGFTELSQKLSPEALVRMLNRIFTAFDDLAEELHLEKIKTIGDCYMVAAGLPEKRADHVEAIARMGLGMLAAIVRINREDGHDLRLRIGVHTGPVVAGVIGKRKFIYDLWGDTVNTASRMESSGVEQEVQVSRDVYDRIKDLFVFEPRGMIRVKGKGEMETFLLKRAV